MDIFVVFRHKNISDEIILKIIYEFGGLISPDAVIIRNSIDKLKNSYRKSFQKMFRCDYYLIKRWHYEILKKNRRKYFYKLN